MRNPQPGSGPCRAWYWLCPLRSLRRAVRHSPRFACIRTFAARPRSFHIRPAGACRAPSAYPGAPRATGFGNCAGDPRRRLRAPRIRARRHAGKRGTCIELPGPRSCSGRVSRGIARTLCRGGWRTVDALAYSPAPVGGGRPPVWQTPSHCPTAEWHVFRCADLPCGATIGSLEALRPALIPNRRKRNAG